MAVRRKRIHDLVGQLLGDNRVTAPPVDVDRIAKSLGIQIRRQPYEPEKISGFLYRDRDRAIIGVNSNHHRHRRRFTVAHEIGHFLLHKAGLDEVHIDQDFQVQLRGERSSKGTDIEEIEANAFAAELLMPAAFLREDVLQMETVAFQDEGWVRKLANRYAVSPQSLVFRLARLGFIRL